LFARGGGIAINNAAKKLVAPPTRRYQWYKDGAKLAAATGQWLKVTTGGAYALEMVTCQRLR